MARIAGVNVPTNKRLIIALTYIYGIGPKSSKDICEKVKIDGSKRVNNLKTVKNFENSCDIIFIAVPTPHDSCCSCHG